MATRPVGTDHHQRLNGVTYGAPHIGLGGSPDCGGPALDLFADRLFDLRGPHRRIIGLDVDPAARDNPYLDEFRLLDENECLRSAVGTIAQRNSCPNPWMYTFDMSVKKAFFGKADGRQIELVADFFNVLNGLNSDWGQLRRVGQTRVLSAQSFDAATGKVRYTANTEFGKESFIGPVRQFQTQLGVRVAF